jgi:hypothetical protein
MKCWHLFSFRCFIILVESICLLKIIVLVTVLREGAASYRSSACRQYKKGPTSRYCWVGPFFFGVTPKKFKKRLPIARTTFIIYALFVYWKSVAVPFVNFNIAHFNVKIKTYILNIKGITLYSLITESVLVMLLPPCSSTTESALNLKPHHRTM